MLQDQGYDTLLDGLEQGEEPPFCYEVVRVLLKGFLDRHGHQPQVPVVKPFKVVHCDLDVSQSIVLPYVLLDVHRHSLVQG